MTNSVNQRCEMRTQFRCALKLWFIPRALEIPIRTMNRKLAAIFLRVSISTDTRTELCVIYKYCKNAPDSEWSEWWEIFFQFFVNYIRSFSEFHVLKLWFGGGGGGGPGANFLNNFRQNNWGKFKMEFCTWNFFESILKPRGPTRLKSRTLDSEIIWNQTRNHERN
jgi:hypothetical protein